MLTHIRAAAIKYSDRIVFDRCHADILHKVFQEGFTEKAEQRMQGFITNDLRFVMRAEAYQIALKAGQTTEIPQGRIFLSEYIWSDGAWDWDDEKKTYYLPDVKKVV